MHFITACHAYLLKRQEINPLPVDGIRGGVARLAQITDQSCYKVAVAAHDPKAGSS
ncbi:MAG: hypothetical protein ACJAVZ_005086 [Afipia broomeae]|jgi:hypothetical protein